METREEFIERRISEITGRMQVVSNYINNHSHNEMKHEETGVGKSYLKRRNSRINANKDYRISEFRSELTSLESKLLILKNAKS